MTTENNEIVAYRERYTRIIELLEKNRTAIEHGAAKNLDVKRLTKLAIGEFRRNYKLVFCDTISVIACVVQAAQLGLEFGPTLGRAYLVPFFNRKRDRQECQLIIGYKGMIELAYRSNRVQSVEGNAVYEGDIWEYEEGLDRRLRHVPKGETDPKKIAAAWALVRMSGGGVLPKALLRAEIEKARLRSAQPDSGPWAEFYPPMAVKTVIRNIFKFCPVSTEMARAVAIEEMGEAGVPAIETLDVELVGEPSDAQPEPQPDEAPPKEVVSPPKEVQTPEPPTPPPAPPKKKGLDAVIDRKPSFRPTGANGGTAP